MGATARIPYPFPAPLVAWARFDVLRDGSLAAAGCTEATSSHPPVVGSSRLAPVVAAAHSAPMPFCSCGVHGLYRPPEAGPVVGLVEVWGRVMLESDGLRAEHGRVLAVAVADDDFDPAAFEQAALPGATLLRRPDFTRAVRARGVRRWHTGSNQGAELARMNLTAYGAALALIALGVALASLGLAAWAATAVAIVLWVALCGVALKRANERTVCVEALVPPPEGAEPGAPLELERGPRGLDLGPVRSALPFLR